MSPGQKLTLGIVALLASFFLWWYFAAKGMELLGEYLREQSPTAPIEQPCELPPLGGSNLAPPKVTA